MTLSMSACAASKRSKAGCARPGQCQIQRIQWHSPVWSAPGGLGNGHVWQHKSSPEAQAKRHPNHHHEGPAPWATTGFGAKAKQACHVSAHVASVSALTGRAGSRTVLASRGDQDLRCRNVRSHLGIGLIRVSIGHPSRSLRISSCVTCCVRLPISRSRNLDTSLW